MRAVDLPPSAVKEDCCDGCVDCCGCWGAAAECGCDWRADERRCVNDAISYSTLNYYAPPQTIHHCLLLIEYATIKHWQSLLQPLAVEIEQTFAVTPTLQSSSSRPSLGGPATTSRLEHYTSRIDYDNICFKHHIHFPMDVFDALVDILLCFCSVLFQQSGSD